jgi:hypothetical protein
MSAIRPGLPSILPQSAPQAGPHAASRATSADFFRAALSQIAGPQASIAKPDVPQVRTETLRTDPPPRDAYEGRNLRPGSLLDIRI